MKQIDLKEHQSIMLNILESFSNYCKNHNLKYYLDAGTLLGAVRHNGFIPWDNDMDVGMLRDDYDKLLAFLKKDNDHLDENIIVERPENTMYQYIKISDLRTTLIEFPNKYPMKTHIYIDVFPKDYLKDKSLRTKILCKRTELLALKFWFNKYSIYAWKNYKNPLKKLIGFFGRILVKHPNKPIQKQDRIIRKYREKFPSNNCEYLTTLVNGEYKKISKKNNFKTLVDIKFGNKLFPCPIGYKEYLADLYGNDYLKIPNPDKRYSHKVLVYKND